MNITLSTTSQRALVLGGGGSAGNAWLIGIIAGLSDAGLDLSDADLVVGTSAGATAAAQLGGATATQLYADILAVTPPQPVVGGAPPGPLADHLRRMGEIIAAAGDAAEMRRGMGARALDLAAAADPTARWRTTVALRLPTQDWPQHRVLLTAVDAHTGDPVVFDCQSGVDLVDAVAASTSGGGAYTIDDRQYMDGGYRRNENADLAVDYGRVLVLSPLAGRTLHPLEWGMQLDAQVEELRAGGSSVETILPDADSLTAFGDNMMDLSRRPPAARAGHEQGLEIAGRIGEFWR